MINHARTLLMNVNGQGYFDGLGEEYIPNDFLEITIPTYLKNIRAMLYGHTPDRLMLNYRTRQYLGLLHVTPLAAFLQQLDTRITYRLDDNDLFVNAFGVAITPGDQTTQSLEVVGAQDSPDASGKTIQEWHVNVSDNDTARIRRLTAPRSDVAVDYVTTGGLSDLLDLPGSTMQFRFQQGVGSSWRIVSTARPTLSLGEIAASLQESRRAYLIQLFGIGTTKIETEPFRTFYNLWQNHHELAYKLGGLLLAYIFRTEEVRLQANGN
jgi:hypothetical protein